MIIFDVFGELCISYFVVCSLWWFQGYCMLTSSLWYCLENGSFKSFYVFKSDDELFGENVVVI